jgi:predicted dehydrogenase
MPGALEGFAMGRHTRRGFLKRLGLAAGAAAAAPYIVPDTATGAAGGVASPSERVTMSIMGCGNRGPRVMGHFLQQPDVQWIAACDCQNSQVRKVKAVVDKHYGTSDCATYRDFRELFDRPDLDGVLIATGTRWHAVGSIYAARAGKDVYSEKPISLTLAEGRALVETCNRLGTIYQAGYQRHSVDSFRFAVECAQNGLIGDLKEIICNFWECPPLKPSPPIPVPQGFWYDMWLGTTPWHPFMWSRVRGWRYVWDTGGGMVDGMGVHWTDLAQWANRAEHTGPVKAEVEQVEWAPPESLTEVPVSCRVALTYENGVRCIMESKGRFADRYIRFVGTDGWVQVRDATNTVTAEPASLRRLRAISAKGWGDPGDHIRNFLEGIKTRRRTVCHPEAAHRAMTLCHLTNLALRLGRTLHWDPAKEEFIDDPEANTMRSRAIRSPWRI